MFVVKLVFEKFKPSDLIHNDFDSMRTEVCITYHAIGSTLTCPKQVLFSAKYKVRGRGEFFTDYMHEKQGEGGILV